MVKNVGVSVLRSIGKRGGSLAVIGRQRTRVCQIVYRPVPGEGIRRQDGACRAAITDVLRDDIMNGLTVVLGNLRPYCVFLTVIPQAAEVVS